MLPFGAQAQGRVCVTRATKAGMPLPITIVNSGGRSEGVPSLKVSNRLS